MGRDLPWGVFNELIKHHRRRPRGADILLVMPTVDVQDRSRWVNLGSYIDDLARSIADAVGVRVRWTSYSTDLDSGAGERQSLVVYGVPEAVGGEVWKSVEPSGSYREEAGPPLSADLVPLLGDSATGLNTGLVNAGADLLRQWGGLSAASIAAAAREVLDWSQEVTAAVRAEVLTVIGEALDAGRAESIHAVTAFQVESQNFSGRHPFDRPMGTPEHPVQGINATARYFVFDAGRYQRTVGGVEGSPWPVDTNPLVVSRPSATGHVPWRTQFGTTAPVRQLHPEAVAHLLKHFRKRPQGADMVVLAEGEHNFEPGQVVPGRRVLAEAVKNIVGVRVWHIPHPVNIHGVNGRAGGDGGLRPVGIRSSGGEVTELLEPAEGAYREPKRAVTGRAGRPGLSAPRRLLQRRKAGPLDWERLREVEGVESWVLEELLGNEMPSWGTDASTLLSAGGGVLERLGGGRAAEVIDRVVRQVMLLTDEEDATTPKWRAEVLKSLAHAYSAGRGGTVHAATAYYLQHRGARHGVALRPVGPPPLPTTGGNLAFQKYAIDISRYRLEGDPELGVLNTGLPDNTWTAVVNPGRRDEHVSWRDGDRRRDMPWGVVAELIKYADRPSEAPVLLLMTSGDRQNPRSLPPAFADMVARTVGGVPVFYIPHSTILQVHRGAQSRNPLRIRADRTVGSPIVRANPPDVAEQGHGLAGGQAQPSAGPSAVHIQTENSSTLTSPDDEQRGSGVPDRQRPVQGRSGADEDAIEVIGAAEAVSGHDRAVQVAVPRLEYLTSEVNRVLEARPEWTNRPERNGEPVDEETVADWYRRLPWSWRGPVPRLPEEQARGIADLIMGRTLPGLFGGAPGTGAYRQASANPFGAEAGDVAYRSQDAAWGVIRDWPELSAVSGQRRSSALQRIDHAVGSALQRPSERRLRRVLDAASQWKADKSPRSSRWQAVSQLEAAVGSLLSPEPAPQYAPQQYASQHGASQQYASRHGAPQEQAGPAHEPPAVLVEGYAPALGFEAQLNGFRVRLPVGTDEEDYGVLVLVEVPGLLKVVLDTVDGVPILEVTSEPARGLSGGRPDGRADKDEVMAAFRDLLGRLEAARPYESLSRIFPAHAGYEVDPLAADLRVTRNGDVTGMLIHYTVATPVAGVTGVMGHVAERMRTESYATRTAYGDLFAAREFGEFGAREFNRWLQMYPGAVSRGVDSLELENALALAYSQVAAAARRRMGGAALAKEFSGVSSRDQLSVVRAALGVAPRAFLEHMQEIFKAEFVETYRRYTRDLPTPVDLLSRPLPHRWEGRPDATLGDYLDNMLSESPRHVVSQHHALYIRTEFGRLDSNPVDGEPLIDPEGVRLELRHYAPLASTVETLSEGFYTLAQLLVDRYNDVRYVYGLPPVGRPLDFSASQAPLPSGSSQPGRRPGGFLPVTEALHTDPVHTEAPHTDPVHTEADAGSATAQAGAAGGQATAPAVGTAQQGSTGGQQAAVSGPAATAFPAVHEPRYPNLFTGPSRAEYQARSDEYGRAAARTLAADPLMRAHLQEALSQVVQISRSRPGGLTPAFLSLLHSGSSLHGLAAVAAEKRLLDPDNPPPFDELMAAFQRVAPHFASAQQLPVVAGIQAREAAWDAEMRRRGYHGSGELTAGQLQQARDVELMLRVYDELRIPGGDKFMFREAVAGWFLSRPDALPWEWFLDVSHRAGVWDEEVEPDPWLTDMSRVHGWIHGTLDPRERLPHGTLAGDQAVRDALRPPHVVMYAAQTEPLLGHEVTGLGVWFDPTQVLGVGFNQLTGVTGRASELWGARREALRDQLRDPATLTVLQRLSAGHCMALTLVSGPDARFFVPGVLGGGPQALDRLRAEFQAAGLSTDPSNRAQWPLLMLRDPGIRAVIGGSAPAADLKAAVDAFVQRVDERLLAEVRGHASMAEEALDLLPAKPADGRSAVYTLIAPGPLFGGTSTYPGKGKELPLSAFHIGSSDRAAALKDLNDRLKGVPPGTRHGVVLEVVRPLSSRETSIFSLTPGKRQVQSPRPTTLRTLGHSYGRDGKTGLWYELIVATEVQRPTSKIAWDNEVLVRGVRTPSGVLFGYSSHNSRDHAFRRDAYARFPFVSHHKVHDIRNGKSGPPRPWPLPVGVSQHTGKPGFAVFAAHGSPHLLAVIGRFGPKLLSGTQSGAESARRLAEAGIANDTPLLQWQCSVGTKRPGLSSVAQQAVGEQPPQRASYAGNTVVGTSGRGQQNYVELAPGWNAAPDVDVARVQPPATRGSGMPAPSTEPYFAGQAARYPVTSEWFGYAAVYDAALGERLSGDQGSLAVMRRVVKAIADSGRFEMAIDPSGPGVTLNELIDVTRAAANDRSPADATPLIVSAPVHKQLLEERGISVAPQTPRTRAMYHLYRDLDLPGERFPAFVRAVFGWALSQRQPLAGLLLELWLSGMSGNQAALTAALAGNGPHLYGLVDTMFAPRDGLPPGDLAERLRLPHRRTHSEGMSWLAAHPDGVQVPQGLMQAVRLLSASEKLPPVPAGAEPQLGARTWADRHSAARDWGSGLVDRLDPAHVIELYQLSHDGNRWLLESGADELPFAEGAAALKPLLWKEINAAVDRMEEGHELYLPPLLRHPILQRHTDRLVVALPDTDAFDEIHQDMLNTIPTLARALRAQLPIHRGLAAEGLAELPPVKRPVFYAFEAPVAGAGGSLARLSVPQFQRVALEEADALAQLGTVADPTRRVVVEVANSTARDFTALAHDPGRRQIRYAAATVLAGRSRHGRTDGDGNPYELVRVEELPSADPRNALDAVKAVATAAETQMAPLPGSDALDQSSADRHSGQLTGAAVTPSYAAARRSSDAAMDDASEAGESGSEASMDDESDAAESGTVVRRRRSGDESDAGERDDRAPAYPDPRFRNDGIAASLAVEDAVSRVPGPSRDRASDVASSATAQPHASQSEAAAPVTKAPPRVVATLRLPPYLESMRAPGLAHLHDLSVLPWVAERIRTLTEGGDPKPVIDELESNGGAFIGDGVPFQVRGGDGWYDVTVAVNRADRERRPLITLVDRTKGEGPDIAGLQMATGTDARSTKSTHGWAVKASATVLLPTPTPGLLAGGTAVVNLSFGQTSRESGAQETLSLNSLLASADGSVDVPRQVTVSVRVERTGRLGVPRVFRANGPATVTVPVRFLVADGPQPGSASLEPLPAKTARALRFADSLDILGVTDTGGQFAGGKGLFDVIRSLVHPALTAPGAPGRSTAFKAGTADRLTHDLHSFFEGWTDSEELVSADGYLRGGYRARGEIVRIAPAFPVDDMFSRRYRQSDRQRSVEVSHGIGGEVGLGPAVGLGLIPGGPRVRLAVRPALMSAISRAVSSKSIVTTAAGPQITGGRIVYQARVRIWAEGTGARSSAMRAGLAGGPAYKDVTAWLSLRPDEAASLGLKLPGDMSTIPPLLRPPGYERTMPFGPSSPSVALSKVDTAQLVQHIEALFVEDPRLDGFLPGFGDANKSGFFQTAPDHARMRTNHRNLIKALSPSNMTARKGQLLSTGIPVRLRRKGWTSNEYVLVRVKGRFVTAPQYKGDIADWRMRSTAKLVGRAHSGEGGQYGASLVGSLSAKPIPGHYYLTFAAAFGATRARVNMAGPNMEARWLTTGSADTSAYDSVLAFDVEVTSVTRPRTWRRYATPGLPGRQSPEVTVIARTGAASGAAAGVRPLAVDPVPVQLTTPTALTLAPSAVHLPHIAADTRTIPVPELRGINTMYDPAWAAPAPEKRALKQWLALEIVGDGAEIRELAQELLADAAGGDEAFTVPGLDPALWIEERFSADTLPSGLARGTKSAWIADDLRYERRAGTLSGAVGSRFHVVNPSVVEVLDGPATEQWLTGGHQVVSAKDASRFVKTSLMLAGAGDPSQTTFLFGGLAPSFGFNKSLQSLLASAAAIDRITVTGADQRVVLVQGDLEVLMAAEAAVGILPAKLRTGGRLLSRSAAALLTEEQARALGLGTQIDTRLRARGITPPAPDAEGSEDAPEVPVGDGSHAAVPEPATAATAAAGGSEAERTAAEPAPAPQPQLQPETEPEPDRAAELRLAEDGPLGLGTVENAPDFGRLLPALRGKLTARQGKLTKDLIPVDLLPERLLDDKRHNTERLGAVLDGAVGLLSSLMDDDVSVELFDQNRGTRAYWARLVLSRGDGTFHSRPQQGRAIAYQTTAVLDGGTTSSEGRGPGLDAPTVVDGTLSDSAGGLAGLPAGGTSAQRTFADTVRKALMTSVKTVIPDKAGMVHIKIPVSARLELHRAGSPDDPRPIVSVDLEAPLPAQDGSPVEDDRYLLFRIPESDLRALMGLRPPRELPPVDQPLASLAPPAQWSASGVRLPREAQANGFRGAAQVRAGMAALTRKLGASPNFQTIGKAVAYTVREEVSTEWLESALPVLTTSGLPLPSAFVKRFFGTEDLDVFLHARLTDGEVLGTGEKADFEAVSGASPGSMGLLDSGQGGRLADSGGVAGQGAPLPAWLNSGAHFYHDYETTPARSAGHSTTETAQRSSGNVTTLVFSGPYAMVQFTVDLRLVARLRDTARHAMAIKDAEAELDVPIAHPVPIRMTRDSAARMLAAGAITDPRNHVLRSQVKVERILDRHGQPSGLMSYTREGAAARRDAYREVPGIREYTQWRRDADGHLVSTQRRLPVAPDAKVVVWGSHGGGGRFTGATEEDKAIGFDAEGLLSLFEGELPADATDILLTSCSSGADQRTQKEVARRIQEATGLGVHLPEYDSSVTPATADEPVRIHTHERPDDSPTRFVSALPEGRAEVPQTVVAGPAQRQPDYPAARYRNAGPSTALAGDAGVQTAAPAPGAAQLPDDLYPGEAVIERLSGSIEGHVVLAKAKANIWAPGTWWPEHWMTPGPARLRRALERRVVRGEVFGDQDLADIATLSRVDPQWLSDVGIGALAEAEAYADGGYKDWLKLAPGKRLLVATLSFRSHGPDARASGEPVPISPDYTLGRFMTTQGAVPREGKQPLYDERDAQIRQTAVDTLHPAGLAPERRHDEADSPAVEAAAVKDAKAREILTAVLLVLQHGLKVYDPQQRMHVDYREGDVIRALAHGGRVNIRVPALREGESRASLTDFLGVTEGGRRAKSVDKRRFATHRTAVGKNKGNEPGAFREKGGVGASLTNLFTPSAPVLGLEPPELMGIDISGGGLGSKDWNGDVVLPNGSYGHMLLVFTAPTPKKDGSLLVGIETIKPHAESPVGYEHDFRSTEATANPESVLHGHKGDKIGSGGLKLNERLVDLRELGTAQGSGDWRAFLDQVKQEWDAKLTATADGTPERRALYEELVGRRRFDGETG